MKKIVFTGGGTGGHIYPGLAIADELKCFYKKQNKISNEDLKIYWIGNSSGMDRTVVEKSVGPEGLCSIDKFYGIPSGKLRRYLTIKNFIDAFKILGGLIASFCILLKIKPSVVFSKGGFVSVPPCLCAKLLGIPVYTHECDFTPGLATKINSRSASHILLSYDETKKFFSEAMQKKLIVTGNPIRPVFWSAKKEKGLSFLQLDGATIKKPVLLVLGGSSGSKQINDLIAENLSWLVERFIIVHQTGMYQGQSLSSVSLPKEYESDYKPYNFIYEQMPDVIACADIILSRAGANSLWECAALLKPMVLIPLCGYATRGDQVDNASYFENHGIAVTLNGQNADSEHLKTALMAMESFEKRKECSESCRTVLPEVKPSEKIASLLYNDLIGNK